MKKSDQEKDKKVAKIVALAAIVLIVGGLATNYFDKRNSKDPAYLESPIEHPATIEEKRKISGNYTYFLNELEKGDVEKIDIDYFNWVVTLKNNQKIEFGVPSWLSDPKVLEKAKEKGAVVNIKMTALERSTTFNDIMNVLVNIAMIFFFGLIAFMLISQNTKIGRNKKKVNIQKIDENFSDIIGQNSAKSDLEDVVEYLKNPEKYANMGARVPKGIILYGPPGTGKTLLARALAKEAGVNYMQIEPSDYNSMFIGVAQKKVKEDFKRAREAAPCIIFIDEIDSVAGKRMDPSQSFGGAVQERNSTLNQLLNELDGFSKSKGIVIIGATNRLDQIDQAILRPGRFDRKVKVDLPDLNDRKNLIAYYIEKKKITEKINIDSIAKRTPGFAGADIENLCNEAVIDAIKKGQETTRQINFENALDKIMLGEERPQNALTDHDRKIVAVHEAGHALCALIEENATPIHKATIAPRGGAGGFVLQLPEDDNQMISKATLKANLAVIMGGRMAEEEINGASKITTGASSDIKKATQIATAMVTKWGMGERNPPYFIEKDALGNLPPHIEKEIKEIIETAQNRARQICKENREKLVKISNKLLEKETLSKEDLQKIL